MQKPAIEQDVPCEPTHGKEAAGDKFNQVARNHSGDPSDPISFLVAETLKELVTIGSEAVPAVMPFRFRYDPCG